MASQNRTKVLLVGPVAGRLRLLSDKLRALQKSKAGPFDVCLCAGPFFHKTTAASGGGGGAAGGRAAGGAKTAGEDVAGAEDPQKQSQEQEREQLKDEALKDAKDLADGALTFDVPVLFVDEGDGFPAGLKVQSAAEALKKDDDEIDLDDDEGDGVEGEDGNEETEEAPHTPEGLLRLANNLYQLVGDIRQGKVLDGAADIVAVPLPLPDSDSAKTREHPTSLTVGFLGARVRLPCQKFEEKAKHTSFLGCDVLISGEWGQGMASDRCGALTVDDRTAIASFNDAAAVGSYDVAELIATSRPRYHLAPGPEVPVHVEEAAQLRRRFVASLPYKYPATSSTSGEGHAGRFLALGAVLPAAEAKALGKAHKFIHAVGIVPLSHMDAGEREAAKEAGAAVDCPYTDASYGVDSANGAGRTGGGMNNAGFAGGLSEARARRLAQEDAASALGGGGGDSGAFRWQPHRKRPRDGDADDEEARRQATEADNPDNCSLFLHGLHRDPGMALNPDKLLDAFRPFGCRGIRFPRPKMGGRGGHYGHQQPQKPSYAFLDFGSHGDAARCLADLRGEATVANVPLTLKWSASHKRPREGVPGAPPPPRRRNRLTEAECGESTSLFLRLPPAIDAGAYPAELETVRLLAQGTMEDELNVGVPLDSPDRITAKDEPALRVTVRHPTPDINYGFLEFASHAAALTTLVALTGLDDGGEISNDKLAISCLIGEDMAKRNLSHLRGVTLFWAKGLAHPQGDAEGGLQFHKRHFPPDSRTDCWFCLASPTCEKHLIVAVHDECYVAMPKGAVNDHHALIVPVEHGGTGALVIKKLAPEMESVKANLRRHAKTALNKDLFVFERAIQTKGGYHTHVQCVPVAAGSGPTIQSKMLEMALRSGFQLKEITSDLGLNALEDDWSDGYFYAEVPLPGGGDEFRRFIYRAGDGSNGGGGKVPLQFGREVLAEVMGNADVGQWKACVVSKEKEEELTTEFRKSLSSVATT
ncbi:hypothetical protein ACHAXT_007031 [Thalassiosira profunda]